MMTLLKPELVNWKECFVHPSEFVRIDQLVRLKQEELNLHFPRSHEGQDSLQKEVEQHKKLLYNIRNFIFMFSSELFGYEITTVVEKRKMINSYVDRPNNVGSIKFCFNNVSYHDFWIFVAARSDRQNSEIFFKYLIEAFMKNTYFRSPTFSLTNQLVEVICKTIDFRVI